jgi:ankyrin repeat protein
LKPASAGFSFLGHRSSFSRYARGEAIRIWWPWKSLPEDLPHSKRLYNPQLICSTNATSGAGNQVMGCDMRDKSIAAEIDSALRIAAMDGDTECVKALLDAGADVHVSVDAPLWYAAGGCHTDTMRTLIDAGADKDIALLEAAANGMVELVKELLRNGANIHMYNGLPLGMAEYNGHTETVRILKQWKRRGTNGRKKPAAGSKTA